MKKNAYESPEVDILLLNNAGLFITTSGINGGDVVTVSPDPWFRDDDF